MNQAGNFANPAAINSFTSVTRGVLLDENGIEIDINANPSTRGKFLIQTADDLYLLNAEGELGQIFEFNNMFEFDEVTTEMIVNSRVSSDLNELIIGRVIIRDGIDTVHAFSDSKVNTTLARLLTIINST